MKVNAYGICIYKKENNITKVLLCKSSTSKKKWGFVKGVQDLFETQAQTALREFKEESSIIVKQNNLEKYFEQENEKKNIGVFLVNYFNVSQVEKYFNNDQLYKKYLSWENSEIRFFSIENLPKIKKKQKHIAKEISRYLQG